MLIRAKQLAQTSSNRFSSASLYISVYALRLLPDYLSRGRSIEKTTEKAKSNEGKTIPLQIYLYESKLENVPRNIQGEVGKRHDKFGNTGLNN